MAELGVDLHEGFDDDHVQVFLNDGEVFNQDSVSTRYQIGLAATIKLTVDPGTHTFRVELPDRGLRIQQDVDVSGETFIGVALDEERGLTIKVSDQPFLYL